MTDPTLREVEQAIDNLAECYRLLGIKQALKERGDYSRDDAILERGMHESAAKHRRIILAALAQPDPDPEPLAWTDDRCKELDELGTLLREVESINRSSSFVERIYRCIALAEKLNRDDLFRRRDSLHNFLRGLAIADRRPGLPGVPRRERPGAPGDGLSRGADGGAPGPHAGELRAGEPAGDVPALPPDV